MANRVQMRKRAADVIGEPVTLVVRVSHSDETVSKREKLRSQAWVMAWLTPFGVLAALALGALGRVPGRSLESTDHTMLAFTESGRRVVLSVSDLRRTLPIGVVQVLPEADDLTINSRTFEDYRILHVRIGSSYFTVNPFDVKSLFRAVENGTIEAPNVLSKMKWLRTVGQGVTIESGGALLGGAPR